MPRTAAERQDAQWYLNNSGLSLASQQRYVECKREAADLRTNQDVLLSSPMVMTQRECDDALEYPYHPYVNRMPLQAQADRLGVAVFEPDQLCARGNFAYAALARGLARWLETEEGRHQLQYRRKK